MAHTIKSRERLLSRLRRMRGQLQALERALESEAECVEVLQQIAAVRGALNGLMFEVLEGHIREHLGPGVTSKKSRNEDIEVIASVLRSYLR